MATSAKIIDGKAIAATIRGELKVEVEAIKAKTGKVPGLAVVLATDRKDSETYTRMKKKMAEECGMKSFGHTLPSTVTQDELIEVVRKLNSDQDVHGILVQLPLPKHINEEEVLAEISIDKDVDGFHPLNIGRLSMKSRDPLFTPCTPKGCIELLKRTGVKIEGKRAVVLGRSNIVGLPAAMLLLHANATVTICHSRTEDLPGVVREADILIAAVGKAEIVKGSWVKPGAVVIDVGTNDAPDPTSKTGYRLVGDVAFDEVKQVASAITPVPGGVGPMTIAMLLSNTVDSAKRHFGIA
mmetsp:Transcript_9734/g.15945  ORF Transcript_9734/g.15945 Transcript_9734/m.15945 type:complete len:297 (+) Transcript_9734:128-1018(+)|eukprot:CAMPEP_0184654088 /NCGR_PEP_ID=MMETSP0308-20130426/11787_1 /TAXON_ID=38269 /ORGANISM="Gloeochaete witrockiana, Strain SAG 46.84" /LENGTH=296 /DNA_ID=CAMNT_0027089901 /DNA_START=108 /DNA_END=998 /DNA_ORIENTATION=-